MIYLNLNVLSSLVHGNGYVKFLYEIRIYIRSYTCVDSVWIGIF